MPTALPALSLIAEPGRRRATLDIAREIERRGFAGISVSSRQHVAKRRPRIGDRAHSVRHRHSADLRAITITVGLPWAKPGWPRLSRPP